MNLPESLEQAFEHDRLAHAYLLYGRRLHRYSDVVIELFCRIVCDEAQACGSCTSCRQIQSLRYPDLTVVNPPAALGDEDPQSESSRIGVDDVRDGVVSATSLTTSDSSYKLFWLHDMAQFTEEASNTLLKVLEEPSGDTLFVLTARSLGDCLPTIRSRCQWIRFQPERTDASSLEETCRQLWPGEDWAQTNDGNNDDPFEAWVEILRGDRRSSDYDWNRSRARGFLTYVLVIVHRRYTGSVPDHVEDVADQLGYGLIDDITERIWELDHGGQPLFVVNSLLEEIHFPGATNTCQNVI